MVSKIYSLLSNYRFKNNVKQWAATHWSNKADQIRIVQDYLQLHESKGLTMDEYYDFELNTQTEEFRRTFLGVNEQRLYLDILNPIKWYSCARNKYIAHKMLENTGVITSVLYCYFDPHGVVENSSAIASSVRDVVRILKAKNISSCVIKATEDSHGDNVVVVRTIEYLENDCILHLYNNTTAKMSEVLTDSPRIFESVIKQTEQFASFNQSSVNTVRFMTALYPNGEAKIIATFIKIGRAGSCVDNAGCGGNVDVSVDVKTGKIQYAIQFDGWRKIKNIEKHPDSGTQLNGVIINNWDAIKAEVIKYQQAFPWCKAAGWDIAITDEGPVVIEVNDFWDRTGQYFIRRGWRNEIRDCYLAWKSATYNWKIYRQPNKLSLDHLRKIESRNE